MRPPWRSGVRSGVRDRWMVSYADMVTLLFACFAALYASSVIPQTAGSPPQVPAPVDEAPAVDVAVADAQARMVESLNTVLERLDQVGVRALRDDRGVVVSMPEASAFAVGQADLSQSARRLIRELTPVLEAATGEIRIEGHSDDTPITTARYTSNWELSAARATEVIRFLLTQTSLPPTRLSAAGYGEFRPLVPNDSPEARARNRRVDIIILK
jgi:chemotaxis protein MotB